MELTLIGLFAEADYSSAMCEGYRSLPFDGRSFSVFVQSVPEVSLTNIIIII